MLRFIWGSVIWTIGLSFLVLTHTSQASVWDSTKSWSSAWEDKYHQWVKSSWSRTVFSDPGSPYYGLKPDCADAVYSMRLIFAAQNSLPFEVVDPTATSRRITNKISKFDHLPQAKRPKAFLAYLYNILSTRSLPNDSYPVAVNRSSFKAGIFGMTVRANQHSWTLKHINSFGVPTFYYSTTGVATQPVVKLLQKKAWYGPLWVFEGAIRNNRALASSHAGFRAFKWPQELHTPALLVSKASMDQYQIPVSDWNQRVQQHLATQTESSGLRLRRLLEDSCTNFENRIDTVNEAWRYAQAKGACLSQSEFYQYSTPSRDSRSLQELADLRRLYQQSVQNGERLVPELSLILSQVFPAPLLSFAQETSEMTQPARSNFCRLSWAPGQTISLAEVRRRLAKGWMSTNPMDSPARRWGESRTPSALAASCPDYNDTWVPDLSEY